MHKTRKFAILTAANVDGANRFALGRPRDVWRYDPRIPRSAQAGDFYYASNQFDRGHQTRYRDMQYGGSPQEAIERGADTLHFTNCAPQHARFNQGDQLWQGLEQHILEQSVLGNVFRAQIFTGPVLDDGDPEYRGLRHPLSLWKVAVAVTSSDALFAAGFILDRSEVIQQFGIEAMRWRCRSRRSRPIRRRSTRSSARPACGFCPRPTAACRRPIRWPPASRRAAASPAAPGRAGESTADVAIPPLYVPLSGRGDHPRLAD